MELRDKFRQAPDVDRPSSLLLAIIIFGDRALDDNKRYVLGSISSIGESNDRWLGEDWNAYVILSDSRKSGQPWQSYQLVPSSPSFFPYAFRLHIFNWKPKTKNQKRKVLPKEDEYMDRSVDPASSIWMISFDSLCSSRWWEMILPFPFLGSTTNLVWKHFAILNLWGLFGHLSLTWCSFKEWKLKTYKDSFCIVQISVQISVQL